MNKNKTFARPSGAFIISVHFLDHVSFRVPRLIRRPMHRSMYRSILDRLSTDMRPTCLDRYIDRYTRWSIVKLSVKHRWSIGERHLYRPIGVSVDVSVDTQLIYQPSIDRYTVDTRPILGRVSGEISIDISTDTSVAAPHRIHVPISFPFSKNLRRVKTISQVLTRTWTDWQTWTCNFERRFRYRRVVDLKLSLEHLILLIKFFSYHRVPKKYSKMSAARSARSARSACFQKSELKKIPPPISRSPLSSVHQFYFISFSFSFFLSKFPN